MRYVYRRKEAQFLERLGEPERAAAVWRELADQGNTYAFVHVGRHCLTMGQRTEAERWFRQGAKACDEDAMQALVFLLAEDGLFDEAAEWTERMARPAHSGDIYAYSRLAYRFERAANLSQAKIYFRKAIDDGLVDCYQDLVRLHYEEGDIEGARRLYAEAIKAGEVVAHGWPAYFGALYLPAARSAALLGDVVMGGLPGRLLQVFLDLPAAGVLTKVKTQGELMAAARKRRQKAANTAQEESSAGRVPRRGVGDQPVGMFGVLGSTGALSGSSR